MQLVIGSTYESSRGFGRLLYLGETHDIDGYLPTFRTTKGDLKFYGYDQLPSALVEFAPPTVSRADELIAYLEGEIAKRDAELCERAEEVEYALADLNNALAELSAIKAQEPVRYWFIGDAGQEKGSRHCKKSSQDGSLAFFESEFDAKRAARRHAGTEVYTADYYAASVSEAKAHGVVMPERQDDQYGDQDAIGWNACLDEVARLNAAPVQQVSVPDGWKLVPVEPTHEMLGAALMNQVECLDAVEVIRTDYKAMLAAAPAAPAIGAGVTTHD